MLHSALPQAVPASASFGERRLGQSHFSKPFALGIGLVTGQFKASQPSPYPSPPMTGSSPPETFITQRRTSGYPSLQESQPKVSEQRTEPLALTAAGESRTSQSVPLVVSSPVARSPFMPQSPPQPQRKTKSHVASACVNCKKAHLACDVLRPCPRCISMNKEDTCKDVQHKKRGRPRLRDDRTHTFVINRIDTMGKMSSHREYAWPRYPPTIHPYPHRTSTNRVIKSQAGDSHSKLNSYALRSPTFTHLSGGFDPRPVQLTYTDLQSELKAFLTVELVIAWSTKQLREFLGYQEHELNCVKSLFDIVLPDDRDRLYRLSRQIQDEVHMKDAAYLFPPTQTVYAAIRNTPMDDVVHASKGSRMLQETLILRLPNGRKYRTAIRIQVIRASVFFVVAELVSVLELTQFNPTSPTQYGPPLPPDSVPSHAHIPPLASPNQQFSPGDSSGPQSPYSLQHTRGLLSPAGCRPRSLHSESTYPSLAQYANSSSPGTSPNWARNSHPHNATHQSLNPRRHSDQPLASSSLTLPPLRLLTSLDRPSSAEDYIKPEPVGSDPMPMPKRIAVEDVLQ